MEMNWGHAVGMEDFGGTVELISQGPRRRTEQRDKPRCDQGGWMSRVSTERKNPVVQGWGEADVWVPFYASSMKVSKNLDSLFYAITASPPSVWKIESGPSNLWTRVYAWK